jgi:Protein of unknown function (DUF1566)
MKRILLGVFSALAVFTAHGQTSGLPAGFPESVFKQLLLGGKVQNQGDPNRFSTVASNPSCRFFDGYIDNGNGTVTDPRNGLMWKKCLEGTEWNGSACWSKEHPYIAKTWLQALNAAKDSQYLDKKGWRLPTKPELQSITGDPANCKLNTRYYPDGYIAISRAIDPEGVDGMRGRFERTFWTSDKWDNSKDKVFVVTTLNGVAGYEDTDKDQFVRLVHDGAAITSEKLTNELSQKEAVLKRERDDAYDAARQKEKDELEAYRQQLRRERNEGKSRGGVSSLNFLDISKTYGVRCNNGTNDVLTINSVSRTYCGSASNGAWECFQQPASAAQHICR